MLDKSISEVSCTSTSVAQRPSGQTGILSLDFTVELSDKYPEQPVIVHFTKDKKYHDQCKEYLEPRGVATFPEIEQSLEVLSIPARCARSPGVQNREWTGA